MTTLAAALAALASVALLALAQERRARIEAEKAAEAARFAFALQTAKLAGQQRLWGLVAEWQREGATYEDDEAAAHALADFLAQRTGETIIATEPGGSGIIVAIPNEEAT